MNQRILTKRETQQRHKQMICKSYELKIDKSHLSKELANHLRQLFLEAKWFTNYAIANGIFEVDYKIKTVQIKVKDTFEERQIKHLSSQMKQAIIDKLKQDVKNLSILKNNGHKVGKIKFKRFVKTIPLKQFGVTYAICDKNHVRIQGIGKKVRVRGIKQIPTGAEFSNAYLIQDHGDYYLRGITYQNPENTVPKENSKNNAVGIDFGLRNQITLSNGISIQYRIPVITKKLRRLYKKFTRTQKGSNNRLKLNFKIQKQFAKSNNIKKDIKNKIVHCIRENFSIVCFQNDDIRQWQRIWGSKILDTAIGKFKDILKKRIPISIAVDKTFPSTYLCSHCGTINEISLAEEIYKCPVCGFTMHRDLKAARDIFSEGLKQLLMEHREAALLYQGRYACGEETSTRMLEYLNSIPYIRASFLYETGSLTASA